MPRCSRPRLLGVRRSWVAVGVAGVVGWVGGNVVALGLAGWDWDAAELSVATVTLSFVFTLLAAVSLDFLARPGTLARGKRAGLIVLPRPMHEIRRRLVPYVRYRQVLDIAHRNGLPVPGLRRADRHAERPPLAIAVRTTLEECGVAFIKLGQMASTRVDLLPQDLRDELAQLQSHVQPDSPEAMRAQLEAEFDRPIDAIFSEFDWNPIGSASIAQAYTARLTTGEDVVVKIQRPDIDDVVERDSAVVMHLEPRPNAAHRRARTCTSSRSPKNSPRTCSGSSTSNRKRRTRSTSPARPTRRRASDPHVYREFSTRRVMVQERFHGPSVADRGASPRSASTSPSSPTGSSTP